MCWLLELYLLFVTKFLIRMRKHFLITNDLLLISLKLSWNDTITWTEWKGGILKFNFKGWILHVKNGKNVWEQAE